jgi:23S rRNA (cytidine1920-2'-O)/16S rRNA (cytidine1409-2'-O)-methyltransferase
MRLDLFLFNHNMVNSRTRANNLIKLNKITVNGDITNKASLEIKETDKVEIISDYPASLGGIKLQGALDNWNIDIKDKICLDVGCSNGGFTEILLNNNAKKIYALDVGECALPDYLKENEKVVVKDKTNARFITKNDFDAQISLAVIDVSFISLDLILPTIYSIVETNGTIIALIKPQFEVTKKDLTKSGILKSKKLEAKVLNKINLLASTLGAKSASIIPAPHPFADKNQEFLINISK